MNDARNGASTARVLLVEDDPAICRLVSLALEDEALTLETRGDVEQALQVLAAGPVDLVITDLMLPGRSGFDLLEALQAEPALRGAARLAAFSAGLNPERRERLRALGVSGCFDKPIAVQDLVRGVKSLLQSEQTTAPVPAPAALEDPFAGDEALRRAFELSCVQQWPRDLLEGDAAVLAQDVGRLHRLAHTLKGSLRLLGAQAEAELALALERQCAPGAWRADLPLAWGELACAVRAHAHKVAATNRSLQS